MSYYVIGGDGQRYGPEETNVLVQWAREGRLIHSTVLIDPQSGQRLTAALVPELSAQLGPPPIKTEAQAIPHVAQPVRPDGRAVPYAAYAARPAEMFSTKSKVAAGLLGIFLGGLGAHRFYLGYFGIGVTQLLLSLLLCLFPLPIAAVWGFIEGILCLTGHIRDADGRPLRD